METHKECLICCSDRLEPLVGYYAQHKLVKCKNCSFVFMQEIPSLTVLSDHYSGYSYTTHRDATAMTLNSYAALLDEFEVHRKTNRLLDVGCGRGWFLVEAKKRGWEVYGTEYSDAAIKLCEAQNISMLQGKLDASNFSLKDFDVITSFEVIEHINNPNEELEQINELLRAGGLFYCTTPNFNSLMRHYLKADYNVIEYPEHLSYYTKKTLNDVVQNHGFKNKKFLSTGISISRITASKNKQESTTAIAPKPNVAPTFSKDEKLRQNISSKWYLKIAKNTVNWMLTTTNLGLTLKGYYIKSN